MDNEGNSNVENAKQAEEARREQIKRDTKDGGVLDKHITEYPFTPKEAFMQHTSNIFPSAQLLEWRNELMRSGAYRNIGVAGKLVTGKKGLKFMPDDTLRPVEKFPAAKRR